MKNIVYLLSLTALLLVSCEGEQGPPGPPGLDGADGGLLLAQVFEVEANFNSANNYSQLFDIPGEIEVFESDVVLAYQLVEVDNGIDIWEPLPRTLFLDDGILLYGFDHSFIDINFFMDGTTDFSLLGTDFTQNQIFRVAIVPAEFAENIDTSNLSEVMGALNITEVQRLN